LGLFGRGTSRITYTARGFGGTTARVTFTLEGYAQLMHQISRIEKFPKKMLTKAAKIAMAKPLAQAKQDAPVGETGLLKKGLKRQLETPNKKKKSVYRLLWDKKFTAEYRKPTSGKYGGKTPEAYYPHSVEFGYKTANGRTAGQYFAKHAVEMHEKDSYQKLVDSLWDSIQELTRGR
jgi:hypothetical protein